MSRLLSKVSGAALVIAASLVVQAGSPGRAAPADAASQGGELTAVDIRKKLEDLRATRHEELRRARRATAEEFRKVDLEIIEQARVAEVERSKALQRLSARAGGADLTQGSGGTAPTEGRGVLGDIDTASLKPTEFDRVRKAAEVAGYHVEQKGDAFTIKELDITVHRQSARETSYGSGEVAGSSGHRAEIARGQNPETAYGLNAQDPAIEVSDNLKKAAHTLDTPSAAIQSDELQKLGKMTGRNMNAIAAVNPGAKLDTAFRQQADLLKQGYSPEASGIVRDNATPAERAQDIAAFQDRCRRISVDAVRAANQHVGVRMDRLAAEARQANDALETAQASGDDSRLAAAKTRAVEAERAIVDFQERQAVAREAAVLNDSGAAKVMADAHGIDSRSKTPSQLREAVIAPDRAALSAAIDAPAKATATGEPAAVEPGAGRGSPPHGAHLRIHPILHWTEVDIWNYTRRENIPIISLYLARNGQRYRSLGDSDITFPVLSHAQTIDEVIAELETTRVPERSGRAMDHESEDAFERLRTAGYL